MEPKFQTSFIPKSPIGTIAPRSLSPVSSFSFIGFLSGLLFFLALAASAGEFLYQGFISNEITQLNTTLIQSSPVIDSEANRNILSFSNQLTSVRTLLNQHVAISSFFDLFQKSILPTVTLSVLTLNSSDKGIVILVSGEAKSYGSVAQQYAILSQTSYITSVDFSNLSLTDTGAVTFKLKATISPQSIAYARTVDTTTSVSAQPTPSAQQTPQ